MLEEYRDFKGIWITKKVWFSKNISFLEKCLLAEIDSLDRGDGCFATNEYLAGLFDMSEGSMANTITKLRNKGHILDMGFDGTKRYIKAIFPTDEPMKGSSYDEGRVHRLMNEGSSFDEPRVHRLMNADEKKSSFDGPIEPEKECIHAPITKYIAKIDKASTKVDEISHLSGSGDGEEITEDDVDPALGFPRPDGWEEDYMGEDAMGVAIKVYTRNGQRIKQSEINQLRRTYETKQRRVESAKLGAQSREKTMTLFARNAVKMLKEAQKIAFLDGGDNHKAAEEFKTKFVDYLIQDHGRKHEELTEIVLIEIFSNKFLPKVHLNSEFHWKNMTSFGYINRNFNKIIRDMNSDSSNKTKYNQEDEKVSDRLKL